MTFQKIPQTGLPKDVQLKQCRHPTRTDKNCYDKKMEFLRLNENGDYVFVCYHCKKLDFKNVETLIAHEKMCYGYKKMVEQNEEVGKKNFKLLAENGRLRRENARLKKMINRSFIKFINLLIYEFCWVLLVSLVSIFSVFFMGPISPLYSPASPYPIAPLSPADLL